MHQSLLSSSTVGSTNRGLVIQALFDLGPTSRAELARLAGVNRTTISGIVQPLIDADVWSRAIRLPPARSGGKPARPLWFSPDARPICGVLLMPEAVHACVVTLDGKILTEHQMLLPDGNGPVEPIIEAIVDCVATALSQSSRPPLGIGVAVGGMVDTDDGTIVAGQSRAGAGRLPRWPTSSAIASGCRCGSITTPVRFWSAIAGSERGAAYRSSPSSTPARSWAAPSISMAISIGAHQAPAASSGTVSCRWMASCAAAAGAGAGTLLRRSDGCGAKPAKPACRTARHDGFRSSASIVERASAAPQALLDRYARNVAVGIANLEQTLALNHLHPAWRRGSRVAST